MKKSWFVMFAGMFVLTFLLGPSLALADAQSGEKVFKKRCAVCHSIDAGKHKNGPSLSGIFGRKAGASDFPKYKGLKGFDAVWDAQNLDKFLTNPKKFVGAKTMAFKLKKESERADVIEYLKTLK